MVPDIAKKGHSFKGAFAYYLHDKAPEGEAKLSTADRVTWTDTRNLATHDPETAKRIMIATASQQDELKKAAGVKATGRKSKAHVYAYSLAWHPDEAGTLTKGEMLKAADESLKALKADHLQAVIVCHADQDHPHLHVIINRVDPLNGIMHPFKNDRLQLSDWANEYERRRGQILTPKREEKRQQREQGPQRAEQGAGLAQELKKVTRPKSEAAILKDLTDAQKVRHKHEWAAFSANGKAVKDQIYADFKRQASRAFERHKAANKAVWKQHFKAERAELRRFGGNESTFDGRLQNTFAAVERDWKAGRRDKGLIALFLKFFFSPESRRESFQQQQNLSMMDMRKRLNTYLDKDLNEIRKQRTATLAGHHKIMTDARAALIEKQNAERAKTREAWRQVYERRGKDPHYKPRQAPAERPADMRGTFASSSGQPYKKDWNSDGDKPPPKKKNWNRNFTPLESTRPPRRRKERDDRQ